ncbi:MAG: NUDIX domain-containing protein [Phycisphaeraceae bacterium]|nr:NUDIX domain-containing protein [Phycisphaeraceae bacterium]
MTARPPWTDRPLFLLHASVALTRDRSLLLVQEGKPQSSGRWNLPGGHVEYGEPLLGAAERELREETSLSCPLQGLLGVYQAQRSVRFVFRAVATAADQPEPGDQILAVRWIGMDELAQIPDNQLVSPSTLRAILRDLAHDRLFPTNVIAALS